MAVNGETFDLRVVQELDRWIRAKGGKVQSRLISEFYAKHPLNKPTLHERLHLLADLPQSKVHLVLGKGPSNTEVEYLELKELGSKPYRASPSSKAIPKKTVEPVVVPEPVTLPKFVEASDGAEYAMVRDPAVVRAVLKEWEPLEPFAFDFKGDVRREGRLSFMQISNNLKQILMVDFSDNPRMAEESGLREYMANPQKVKIILDCGRPADAVRGVFGVEPIRIFDLSRAFVVVKQHAGDALPAYASPSLVLILRELGLPFQKINKPEESWFKRPLSTQQVEYSCRGVMFNVAIYDRIMHQVEEFNCLEECFDESAKHALSLKDMVLDEGEPGADWSCAACGFKNFARRYTCRKCDAPKPEKFVKKPSKTDTRTPSKAVASTKPVRPMTPEGEGNGTDHAEEDAAFKLALELSLKEEQERIERTRKSQVNDTEKVTLRQRESSAKTDATGLQQQKKPQSEEMRRDSPMKEKPSKGTSYKSASLTNGQQTGPLPIKTVQSSPIAKVPSPAPTMPLVTDLFPSLAPNFMNDDYGHQSDSSPVFQSHLVAGVLDDVDSPSTYAPGSSTSSTFGSIDISNGTSQYGSYSSSSFVPFGSSVDTGFGHVFEGGQFLSSQSSFGDQGGVSLLQGFGGLPNVLPPKQQRFPSQPVRQPSPPGPLTEDEQLILSLDINSLLEEVGLESAWADAVYEAASKLGARTEVIETPLPLLAKELELAGMKTGQRSALLKGIHSRKVGKM